MLDFGIEGLIIPILLIALASFIRVGDCLKNKRNLIVSTLISIVILSINWIFAGSMFLGLGHLGGHIKSSFYLPYYMQWAYFVICGIVGLYSFSKFYMFGDKFYSNFRDKGIYSFKK